MSTEKFENSTIFAAIEYVREEFNNIVQANHSHLDVEAELDWAKVIIFNFGEGVWLNMDPQSVYWGLINQAKIGLSIEPGLNHATFLQRFDFHTNFFVLEFMPIYHGLIHLAFESGEMEQVSGDVILEGDHFKYNGSTELPEHSDNGITDFDRQVIASYAIAKTRGGSVYCQAMSRQELEEIELNARMAFTMNNTNQSSSVWDSAFKGQMYKKSAIRRMLRLLFNQLGFNQPHYRERLKLLMSVEDNMWNNIHSSLGTEMAKRQKEKQILGEDNSAAVPNLPKVKPVLNAVPKCVSRTGVSAQSFTQSVVSQSEVRPAFAPKSDSKYSGESESQLPKPQEAVRPAIPTPATKGFWY
ncbi:recombinase RecT (plasmid) [Vibrio scophthalmi]|uniref:recombinase RecT n=1 Tax=Vibrio scophthalmi TaxID=45658 RepID=UPI003EB71119